MRGFTVAALLAAATSPATAEASSNNDGNTTACARGLYIIVARGTGEPQGAGLTGLLAERIQERIEGSLTVPLVYPATLTDPKYDDSVGDGVKAMQAALDKYTAACPDSKVAILAYSQGAQVSVDTICGGSGDGFDDAKPLAMNKVKDNIMAIVLFGDPSHVANTTYDKGTSIRDGIFQRKKETVGICDNYADRIMSVCDTGDIYCDSGDDAAVHHLYIEKYGDEALQFVTDRFGDCAGGGNSTSGSGNSTSGSGNNGSAGDNSTSGNGTGGSSGGGSSTKSGTATTRPTSSQSSAAPTATGGGGGGGGSGNGSGTSAASLPGHNWFLGALLAVLAAAQAL